jgi:hypothetical protein
MEFFVAKKQQVIMPDNVSAKSHCFEIKVDFPIYVIFYHAIVDDNANGEQTNKTLKTIYDFIDQKSYVDVNDDRDICHYFSEKEGELGWHNSPIIDYIKSNAKRYIGEDFARQCLEEDGRYAVKMIRVYEEWIYFGGRTFVALAESGKVNWDATASVREAVSVFYPDSRLMTKRIDLYKKPQFYYKDSVANKSDIRTIRLADLQSYIGGDYEIVQAYQYSNVENCVKIATDDTYLLSKHISLARRLTNEESALPNIQNAVIKYTGDGCEILRPIRLIFNMPNDDDAEINVCILTKGL